MNYVYLKSNNKYFKKIIWNFKIYLLFEICDLLFPIFCLKAKNRLVDKEFARFTAFCYN